MLWRHGSALSRGASSSRDCLGHGLKSRLGLRLPLGNRGVGLDVLVREVRGVLDGLVEREALLLGRLVRCRLPLRLLRRLGGAEQLGERAVTHAGALSRH